MGRKFKRIFSGKFLTAIFASFTILAILLIFIFILSQGLPIFERVGISDFLFNTLWRPVGDHPSFGVLPLICGSLLVTGLALLMAVPLSLFGAIYIAEISHPKLREILKPAIEILAGIPSIVYGFFGLVVLVPFIKNVFGLPVGETALTGGIILTVMVIPIILSISEDAISSVPREYKEASLALGATRWRTIRSVTIPAAAPGIIAGIILGFGRAIGEAMAVMMVVGGSPIIPASIFSPVRTMPQTIAAEMGEVAFGGVHYNALFAVGMILLISTVFFRSLAGRLLKRSLGGRR